MGAFRMLPQGEEMIFESHAMADLEETKAAAKYRAMMPCNLHTTSKFKQPRKLRKSALLVSAMAADSTLETA